MYSVIAVFIVGSVVFGKYFITPVLESKCALFSCKHFQFMRKMESQIYTCGEKHGRYLQQILASMLQVSYCNTCICIHACDDK